MTSRNWIDSAFEFKDVTDTGSFVGMGSVFGNIDQGDDIVLPGAFADSLRTCAAKGRMPAMLWQHRSGEPIGAWQAMTEIDKGLEVTGRLAMKTQRGGEAYELMKMGALSGLSIGGYTTASDYNEKTGVRSIKTFDLMEVSPVTFPMNDSARIGAVKNIDEIGDLSGAERYLRDAGGLSRSEAKSLIGRVRSLCLRDAGADESAELKAIATLLEQRKVLFSA
jgi:uncharacterized protein